MNVIDRNVLLFAAIKNTLEDNENEPRNLF